ncbi:carboxypeptidase-like regulatory domain-containing protein [Hymenobacter sediminis]|uniref:carboxypeptidase-like regulatory domain-containing protein n=1 Tax=Hymenobacter sediminis TaxID=2218621 RepID=UPI0034DB2ACA
MVAVNGVMLTTDTAGRFRAELLPGKYRIRAGFIGYYRVDVKKLKLRKGEQVALTVLVVEDDRPLY